MLAPRPVRIRSLSDAGGHVLYLLASDRAGPAQKVSPASCEGDCLVLWEPVAATERLANALNTHLIGSLRRADGTVQATYAGWPLYRFAEDVEPGDANGHHFQEFGNRGYLVSPAGSALGGFLDAGVSYAAEDHCVCQTVAVASTRAPRSPNPAGQRDGYSDLKMADRFAADFAHAHDAHPSDGLGLALARHARSMRTVALLP